MVTDNVFSGTQKKQQDFSASKAEPKDDGIHWAGGLHSRNDFNKRKDPIVNWTEVLFRN